MRNSVSVEIPRTQAPLGVGVVLDEEKWGRRGCLRFRKWKWAEPPDTGFCPNL